MITNYSANLILTALCGKRISLSLAPTCYVGLSSTTPTKAGENISEPTGESYKRVLLGNYQQLMTQLMGEVSSENDISNKEIVYFPEVLESWGTLTHFVIFDGEGDTAKALAYGQLTNAITPSVNSVPLIRVGELVISLT